jgi:DNA-binding NarL/FixJ family response regulator
MIWCDAQPNSERRREFSGLILLDGAAHSDRRYVMPAGDSAPARIRTLIVIDVRLYREGLASTLRDHERLAVVGTAGSRAEALLAVATHAPQLVIIDVALRDALQLMSQLRAETPTTRIVAFAVEEDIAAILDCAEAGAAGFVTANASVDELVHAIERTIAGELLCSPRMAAELLRRAVHRSATPSAPEPPPGVLTVREQQVLAFIQQGLSNKEIAAQLHIAEATVKNHVHHVLEKLDVPTRNFVTAYATAAPLRGGLRRVLPSRQAG